MFYNKCPRKWTQFLAAILLILCFSVPLADAASMNDYCLVPPYVGGTILPNLLLMLDNSASMGDLVYTDTAHTYCANSTTTACSPYGSTCSGAASCIASSTTTTSTVSSTPVLCPGPAYSDAICQVYIATDFCVKVGSNKGQCKNAKYPATTQVTLNPISCTTDAQCRPATATCPATCTAPDCSCNFVTNDTCNNKCTVTRTCIDDTFSSSPTTTYYGYFSPTVKYCYSSEATVGCAYTTFDEFDGWGTMPASCTYGGSASTTPYVCVNTSTLSGSEKVTQFIATGNFLNWLTASKMDIEKQILTGGKHDSMINDLVAETRGCAGRKFIKTIPGLGLTFAVRGGTSVGITASTSQASEYGTAYVEIYTGAYNVGDCTAAVNDWATVNQTNLGTVQNDTKNCLGGSSANPALVAANQVIHDCYWYYTGHGLSNLQPLKNACINVWSSGIGAESITNMTDPAAVCSKVIPHPNSLFWNSGDPGYNMGFLGLCFSGGAWDDSCALKENKDYCASLGGTPQVVDPASTTVPSGAPQGIPGFLQEAGLSSLPMINSYVSTYGGTSHVMNGFRVYVYDRWNFTTWPPTGVIYDNRNEIRFGAMKFQNDGSGSECNTNGYCSGHTGSSCSSSSTCPDYASGETCIYPVPCFKKCSITNQRTCNTNLECPLGETCAALPKTDGGIISFTTTSNNSYVGSGTCSITATTYCLVDDDCPASESCTNKVGDHTIGFIKTIDDIKATSWTPFGETFYNALGYFARWNDPNYTVSPPASRDFNFTGFPASYDTSKNPSQKLCQTNNIMIITDGMSTADRNPASENLAALYSSLTTTYPGASGYDSVNKCPSYLGSRSIAPLAWAAKHVDIKTLSTSVTTSSPPQKNSEFISTYVAYYGPAAGSSPGLCDPYNLMNATAYNGGTKGLMYASDPVTLKTNIANALSQLSGEAASGTAASVLASGEGSGANLIQAVFYPRREFSNHDALGIDNPDTIYWTGRMTNLWYYVDPNFSLSNIRQDDGNKIMNLVADGTVNHQDYILSLYFDKSTDKTMASRYTDTMGTGIMSSLVDNVEFETVPNLWEAGTLLWKRNVSNSAALDFSKRKIYTTIDGRNLLSGNFSADGLNGDSDTSLTLQPYLQAATQSEAQKIIKWVHGIDDAAYRTRNVKIESIDTTPRTWKLGDVVNSTPRIQSWTPLNGYHKTYKDKTYSPSSVDPNLEDPVDMNSFTTTTAYKQRGMIYAGGNDGMMHAFKLGTLQLHWDSQGGTEVARLVDPTTGAVCSSTTTSSSGVPTCGQEVWSFIPKNALPYLKYMADKSYCHLYSIDLSPYLFDASIGAGGTAPPDGTRDADKWRTILIGGMRFGGACRKTGAACNGGTTDCVNTPLMDPGVPSSGLGYSSYFALDVTETTPTLLWEFSDDALGYATSGPVIVRISGRDGGGNPNPDSNGHWFAVFASGPTGPIVSGEHQFLGRSDQPLTLFIRNLNDGTEAATITTTLTNAFAGQLNNASMDTDLDYQDDVVYIPYTQMTGTSWTGGGVLRLVTKENPDAGQWDYSTLISGIGPITTSVTKLQDNNNSILWTYFGTGRYYYVMTNETDDADGPRSLYGVKDPCYGTAGYDSTCTTPAGVLTNVTSTTNVPSTTDANSSTFKGWQIDLDPSGPYTYPPDDEINYNAERVITDPVSSTRGYVVFTSYKPYTNQCDMGGKSFIWAIQYNTGGAPVNPLQGKVMVQVSTGAIEQKDLSSAFGEKGGRRSSAMEGKPPEGGTPSVQSSPTPVKRIIHIRER